MGHRLSHRSGEISRARMGVVNGKLAVNGGTGAEPKRSLRKSSGVGAQTSQTALLLLPNFPLMGVTAAIEVMRHANRLSRKELYRWFTYSSDGGAVRASNGLVLNAEKLPQDGPPLDSIFVCGGF